MKKRSKKEREEVQKPGIKLKIKFASKSATSRFVLFLDMLNVMYVTIYSIFIYITCSIIYTLVFQYSYYYHIVCSRSSTVTADADGSTKDSFVGKSQYTSIMGLQLVANLCIIRKLSYLSTE